MPPVNHLSFHADFKPVTYSDMHLILTRMSMTSPNSTIDWAPFLEEIRYLYLEKRWTLPRVQDYMRKNRRLSATQGYSKLRYPISSDLATRQRQYKGLFKKLKIRKNLTFSQWHSIYSARYDRARRGKDSQFIINGKTLDDAQVARELKRYGARFEHMRTISRIVFKSRIQLKES